MISTRCLRIAIGLAAALGQAHRQGLIHKDVKPANALVDGSGHAWLIGFGIASRLPREHQSPEAPEFIAGSLPYMAPEQTGRMNRSMDTRSDLYSLGVTLYELLTNSLPFTASDPMEWVHCQIARQPASPCERAPNIPGPVSAIIMKLLAKTAEERYQTAVGLKRDLERCLTGWETHGRIEEFPLGERDNPDRLLIPEKLYGRQREVETLVGVFDRVVRDGAPVLVLVSGYSGIGKSSVVNELHKALVPPRGLFASGKFDQYKRGIPYATLGQACRGLVRSLLAESEAQLSHWRDDLRAALGSNGRLAVNLVPELELIIGPQPPVADLAPQEARHRFQTAIRGFIGVFARKEHPLALFLDDLQWLDAATLDLLGDLMARSDIRYLMLVGAYRDNEVDSTHPMMQTLEGIRRAGVTVREIVLAPLSIDDLGRLLADSLHCETKSVAALARLVHAKTAGNPFFAVQFIASLAEEGLLCFDRTLARWSWDMSRIDARDYGDNVADHMVGKLNRLPVESRRALQQLACLGHSSEFSQLGLVYEHSQEEMHRDLREAVRTGLVLPSGPAYRFLHDRIQEAAYSSIPETARGAAHLRIGRLLAARTAPGEMEDKIFEIVSHLNRGCHLITSAEERGRIAELNLIAGRRAKAAIAYASALGYFAAGAAVLPEDSWARQYRLSFDLELNRAECEFLTGEMAMAKERLARLAPRAASRVDRAAVIRIQVSLHTNLGESGRAVELCLTHLRDLGVIWAPHPTDQEVREEYERMCRRIGGRAIASFIDLAPMHDAEWCGLMDAMATLSMPAGLLDTNLMDLVVLRMANLSLEHGNSDASCTAYVHLSLVLGPRFGDYHTGYQFGQLSVDLVDKLGLGRFKTRVYETFGAFAIPWIRHIREGYEFARRACEAGPEGGDVTFASYAWWSRVTSLLGSGHPLEEVQVEAESGLAFARKAHFHLAVELIAAPLRLIRQLRGLTPSFATFNEHEFDEAGYELQMEHSPLLKHAIPKYWTRKLQARFYAGDYPSAVAAAASAQLLLGGTPPAVENIEYHYYAALAHAACFVSSSREEGSRHFSAIVAHHRRLTLWAEECPANFFDRAALVGAEIARLEGRELDAERLYEEAIRSARENGFIQNEGVAQEVAARFYAARGFETIGNAYLQNARSCYLRWGADGKVRQLDQMHPHLRNEEPPLGPSSTIVTPIEHLDLATVIKVSQAVSGEMLLPKLIEKLVRIAIEHAGAERGLLVLVRDGEPRIEAEATTRPGKIEVAVRHAVVTPSDLPQSALHYLIRTQEGVLLDDASADYVYSKDEYVRRTRSRSILCLPIVKQTQLVGALYLENNLAPRVFTPDRVSVLQLLASQAAISLENAGLYSDLQRSEAFLAQGQKISQTGSFGWNVSSNELHWSEETYNIVECDRAAKPTLDLIFHLVHPDDGDFVRQTLEHATKEKTHFDIEHRLLMPDGRIKHVHIIGRAVNSGDLDFVGAVRDVTDRVRAEEALRQAQGDLARINRATTMGELTASLAHEISPTDQWCHDQRQHRACESSGAMHPISMKCARSSPELQEMRSVPRRSSTGSARNSRRAL